MEESPMERTDYLNEHSDVSKIIGKLLSTEIFFKFSPDQQIYLLSENKRYVE